MSKNITNKSESADLKKNDLVKFFHAILSFSFSYPKIIMVSFFILFIITLSGFKKIRLELDIYDVKNDNFASSLSWFKLRDEFKDPNSLYLIWKPSNTQDASAHCLWQQEISSLRNKEDKITRVLQVYSMRAPIEEKGDLLYQKIINDPCQFQVIAGQFEKLRNSYLGPVLIDKNFSTFITEVSFEGDAEKNDLVDINDIEKVAKSLVQKNKEIDPEGTVNYLGPLSYRIEFKKILQADSYLNLGLLLFIVIFFRFFLGTWSSGIIYSFATVLTLVYTFGILLLFDLPIDILSNNLVLLTVIAGTADFLFLSLSLCNKTEKNSYYDLITPSFFTTFTTMVGFASLYFSDLDLIRRFGVFAAIGAFFEWSVFFVLIPVIRKHFNMDTGWVNPQKSFRVKRLNPFLNFRMPRFIVYTFIAFSLLSTVAWRYLNYSDSPKNNFPQNHPLRASIEMFQKDFSWEGNISLLFNKDVTVNEIDKIHEKIKLNPLVYFIENKHDLLKSWTHEIASIPRKELIVRDFESTPLNSRFESIDYQRSVIYLKSVNTIDLENFQNDVKKLCNNKCFLSGQSLVYLELNKRVSYTMIESFVVSILLVLLIIWALMSMLKIEGAKFKDIAISTLVGPMFMMTVIAVLQIPVNVVTSVFFAALVGLTGDNAIQYLFAAQGGTLEHGLKIRGEGSLIFAILLMIGSLFLVGQTLIPLKWLGFLFSFGFVINFIGDYWVLKSLNK